MKTRYSPDLNGRNVMELEANSLKDCRGYQQFARLQKRICRLMNSQFPPESGNIDLFDHSLGLYCRLGEKI